MKYVEKRTLDQRGPVDREPPLAVEGSLLVGEFVAWWQEGHGRAGHDEASLAPAFYRGERAWLLRRAWQPAYGYSAGGADETVLTFREGAELLLERGAFELLFARGQAP